MASGSVLISGIAKRLPGGRTKPPLKIEVRLVGAPISFFPLLPSQTFKDV